MESLLRSQLKISYIATSIEVNNHEGKKIRLFHLSEKYGKKGFWKVFVGDGTDVTVLVDADFKG